MECRRTLIVNLYHETLSDRKPRGKIDMTDEAWTIKPPGVVVCCRLTPKAGRDAIDGVAAPGDGTRVLLAHVRAAPENGRANRGLCALLAAALGVPASKVTIIADGRSRIKRIAISGRPKR
jgi:uncharacterized protein YggU (UPF0235/DUF167 family)